MSDKVLRLELLKEATVVEFADEISVVLVAKQKEVVTEIANEAVDVDSAYGSQVHPIAILHNQVPKIGAGALTSVLALLVRVKDDCKAYASILCGEC
ncbi:hypothetical protein TSAR_016436 [Trichomalopsis sarcophagae]|uniref:Uncharacterized protein n=1 Tax=Trichomalopsis sarcophagae TaxID=543379 RepID=A0A232EGE2_9HYME|nr:hypothetical protein TSAR_016436 [Trichomalopsis sarcophagae]